MRLSVPSAAGAAASLLMMSLVVMRVLLEDAVELLAL